MPSQISKVPIAWARLDLVRKSFFQARGTHWEHDKITVETSRKTIEDLRRTGIRRARVNVCKTL